MHPTAAIIMTTFVGVLAAIRNHRTAIREIRRAMGAAMRL